MKREAFGALVVIAVGIGLVDPYACVQYSSGSALAREVPARERARVLVAVRRALAMLPEPRGYELDDESMTSGAERTAAWRGSAGQWAAPVAARAERAFEPPDPDRSDAPPALEQRVFANSEVGPPSGLASETGTLRDFPIPGASALEATTAGMDDPPGGRVALPAGPAQSANALTIIRVLIADPSTERAFRAAAGPGSVAARPRRAPARAGSVETLVIEVYGGRRDVEGLARRIPALTLRRLLDR
ncbi:MAG TPA: hypothetical protein VE326_02825 [Candidatus Binatia bacterium]|nr:hypothetical protein [Candidatus Binatia bacterium]